ncbi:MAG: RDD family protein [Agriterribacter sp.]
MNNSPTYKSNLGKRIAATLLDYALFGLPIYIYILVFGQDDGDGAKSVHGVMTFPIPVYWFLYFVVVEALYGATFAHQALNLKVLTLTRKRIGFTEALKRHLLDPVDYLFYGIPAIISISKSEKRQRLGDMWAETIVVDTKDPEQV